MLRTITAVFLCVLLCVLFLNHLSAPLSRALMSRTAEAHNARGLDHRYSREPEQAIAAFLQAIESAPHVAEYHFNLSLICGNFREAAARALGLHHPGVYAMVMDESRKARNLAPEDYEYAEYYASNFFFAKDFGAVADWDQAAAAWKYCRVLKTRKTAAGKDSEFMQLPLLLTLARIELNREQRVQARAYIEAALSIDPDLYGAKKLLERTR